MLLVPAHTVLDRELLRLLESHHILLEDYEVTITPSFSGQADFEQSAMMDECVLQMEEIFQGMRHTHKVPLLDIRQNIIPMIHQTTERQNLFGLFAVLQSKDDYTYRHNIGVGVISTLIGRWLNLQEAELSQLTMAATLHDVGKVKIPLDILNKPGKLTDDEYATMKKHTVFGYEIIKETVGTNHRQALVALQHHERQDGSGYPLGTPANRIDLFSRIVAVADIFHAMSSRRSYRNASPFYSILKQMENDTFGALDPEITRLFLGKIMQSLIGNEVLLSDGSKGRILMINKLDPTRPLVRVEDVYMDLSKEHALNIEQVIV